MSFRIIFITEKKDKFLFDAFNYNKKFMYQKDISKEIGIHEKNFSKIINGKKSVSIKTAKKMMEIAQSDDLHEYFRKYIPSAEA